MVHFFNEALSQVGKCLGLHHRRHCAYHPASEGAVERENFVLKRVFCGHGAHVHADEGEGISPLEVFFGRPLPMGVNPSDKNTFPSADLCENTVLSYCRNLHSVPTQINSQVKAAQPLLGSGLLHSIQPGNLVLVKDLCCKHRNAESWNGPFQVLLTICTTIKIVESL